jgi:hypothetical protein
MRVFTAALAALVVATAAAVVPAGAAEMKLSDPTAQIENLTAQNVTAILQELGAQQIETHQDGGKTVVTFKDGEVPFNLGFALCDVKPKTCLALVMVVGFDPGATRYPLELFNTFNKDNSFVTAVALDGNRFAVSRMLFTDGGVSRKNVAANVANFAAAPQVVMKFLASQIVAGTDRASPAPFQQVNAGANAVRPVALSPQEMAAIVNAQHLPDGAGSTLRR